MMALKVRLPRKRAKTGSNGDIYKYVGVLHGQNNKVKSVMPQMFRSGGVQ
jgi:hypothetical protein